LFNIIVKFIRTSEEEEDDDDEVESSAEDSLEPSTIDTVVCRNNRE
jgi:hypothetical protein